jgi:pimeloyl-ACP methyl ester carboxylesterase
MRRLYLTTLFVLLLTACGPGEEEKALPAPTGPLAHSERVLSFDGVPIAYTVAGEGQGALLFIHGWACDRYYWASQLYDFAETHTVATVDLAGHGDSGSDRADWTLESLARDVQAVVDHLDLHSVILVGHSMGGPVALEAARLMPDRVVGVIGVDTLQDVGADYGDEWDRIFASYEADFAGTCAEFVKGMFYEDADTGLVTEITEDMCEISPEVGMALLRAYAGHDLSGSLSSVEAPVRAINSPMWPTNVESNRQYDPDFEVLIIEGSGHFPMREKREEFDRLLEQVIEEITSGETL